MSNPLPIPSLDPISTPRRMPAELKAAGLKPDGKDPLEGRVTDSWARWLVSIAAGVNQAPIHVINPIALTAQNASISSTAIAPNQTSAGLYRLSTYARVTTVDAVSSSLQISFSWTDHGQTMAPSLAAITGNTVTTFQSATQNVYIDAQTPIKYSTTYSSNTPGQMVYELYITLEAMHLGLA